MRIISKRINLHKLRVLIQQAIGQSKYELQNIQRRKDCAKQNLNLKRQQSIVQEHKIKSEIWVQAYNIASFEQRELVLQTLQLYYHTILDNILLLKQRNLNYLAASHIKAILLLSKNLEYEHIRNLAIYLKTIYVISEAATIDPDLILIADPVIDDAYVKQWLNVNDTNTDKENSINSLVHSQQHIRNNKLTTPEEVIETQNNQS